MRANPRNRGPAADLLGFLESLGFRFDLAGPGQDQVRMLIPPLLRCMADRVRDVLPALRIALEARATKPETAAAARRTSRFPRLGEVALDHKRRGEWDAYVYAGELTPIFCGTATSEEEARQAAREKFAALTRRKS